MCFQALQADMEQGHAYLKALRERAERAILFLEGPEAEQLTEEVDAHVLQLQELQGALRVEHCSLEKCMCLSKDFTEKHKAQAQWVKETRNLLASSVEPKAELYQKKAQLAKYKVSRQGDAVLKRAGFDSCVFTDHPAGGAVPGVHSEVCPEQGRGAAGGHQRPLCERQHGEATGGLPGALHRRSGRRRLHQAPNYTCAAPDVTGVPEWVADTGGEPGRVGQGARGLQHGAARG